MRAVEAIASLRTGKVLNHAFCVIRAIVIRAIYEKEQSLIRRIQITSPSIFADLGCKPHLFGIKI
jgi:hypothetical protein